MGYIPDEYLPFMRGTDGGLRLALFFRLGDTEPNILRLWLGAWRVRMSDQWVDENWVGIDSVDEGGKIYRGCGRLLGFPDLEVSTNAQAPRISLELSGVSPETTELLDVDFPDVTGMPATFGFTTLDDRFQPEFPIQRLWTGYADYVTEERKPDSTPDKPWQWKIGLSMGSGDGRRSKPLLTAWTQEQHHLVHPTDNFFSQISRYVQGLRIAWPNA